MLFAVASGATSFPPVTFSPGRSPSCPLADTRAYRQNGRAVPARPPDTGVMRHPPGRRQPSSEGPGQADLDALDPPASPAAHRKHDGELGLGIVIIVERGQVGLDVPAVHVAQIAAVLHDRGHLAHARVAGGEGHGQPRALVAAPVRPRAHAEADRVRGLDGLAQQRQPLGRAPTGVEVDGALVERAAVGHDQADVVEVRVAGRLAAQQAEVADGDRLGGGLGGHLIAGARVERHAVGPEDDGGAGTLGERTGRGEGNDEYDCADCLDRSHDGLPPRAARAHSRPSARGPRLW